VSLKHDGTEGTDRTPNRHCANDKEQEYFDIFAMSINHCMSWHFKFEQSTYHLSIFWCW